MSTTITQDEPSDAQVAQAQFDRIIQEARTFAAEQNKLAAEAAKLRVDRFFAPFVVVASLGSGLLVAVLSHVWH